jgi:hypothetical protein
MLKNLLMISFVISLITSSSRADIPQELKSSEEPRAFMVLSKTQAQEAQMCFARETLYKKAISDGSSPWPYFIIGAFAGILTGAVITINH